MFRILRILTSGFVLPSTYLDFETTHFKREDFIMPTVGKGKKKKKFKYTKAGMKKAKAYAKRTGKKVKYSK